MPEIEIRPAVAADIQRLVSLDHHYATDHAWQMEVDHQRELSQVTIGFREIRLPRAVRVEYPRSPASLTSNWAQLSGLLVACLAAAPIAYAGILLDRLPGAAWVSDLVVNENLRRKGIGSGLVFAALDWATSMDCNGLVLEMQPKNYPAIRLAIKLGFEFCGYNDGYYTNHEIGIFFRKVI